MNTVYSAARKKRCGRQDDSRTSPRARSVSSPRRSRQPTAARWPTTAGSKPSSGEGGGQLMCLGFEVTDVTMPLVAVRCIIGRGNAVHFT